MPRKLRAASAAQAVKGFKAVEALKAAEPSAVSSLQGYAGPAEWASIAYVSMCERTGSAGSLVTLEPGAWLESDGTIIVRPPAQSYGPLPWWRRGLGAEFEVPASGAYACTVRSKRPENFAGNYEFAVDYTVLGRVSMPGGIWPSYATFVVRLAPGRHIFWIRPTWFAPFVFQSLTVFAVPERG
jgi:hypothetical protein